MTDAPPRSVQEFPIRAVRGGGAQAQADQLAVEEPLEIRLRHGPAKGRSESTLGLTMRTPGHDEELAAGLLLSEGVVRNRKDLQGFGHGRDRDGHPDPNIVIADLDPSVSYDPHSTERLMMRSSACGICGRASLDALRARSPPPLAPDAPRIRDADLRGFPERLRGDQRVFAATGGLHAAALFDDQGSLRSLREDVGRHNAVDKLLGAEFLAGRTPLGNLGLLVSGRAGYEILQKALAAGVPFVAALGAPSSLAAELAREFGQTLVGFLKADGYNVYAGGQRLETTPST